MVRTQIQLTQKQHRKLKKWASQRGISLAEAVRRLVDEKLIEEEIAADDRAARVRAALALIGKYRDPRGRSRVAKDHDAHFADAALQ